MGTATRWPATDWVRRRDVVRGGVTEADGSAAAIQLLSRPVWERPTAVVAFNDRVAIGLRDGLLRAGVRVPEDVSVVGYDDSPMARLGTIDLTSVSQEPQLLARATVERVEAALQGQPVDSGEVVVSPRLVVRSSSGPPAEAR